MYYSIHLSFGSRVSEHVLHFGNENNYELNISSETGKKDCFIRFEKNDGRWRILNDRNVLVTGDDVIRDGSCSEIEVKSTVLTGALFVSALEKETACFERFCTEKTIVIGSDRDCDIVLKGEYISRKHAVISIENGVFSIKDLSENGTFVNGVRTDGSRQLELFDVIWIFGVKIVFTGDSLAVQKNCRIRDIRLEKAELMYETEKGRRNFHRPVELLERKPDPESECRAVIQPPAAEAVKNTGRGISEVLKTAVPAAAVLSAVTAFKGDLSVAGTVSMFAGGTAAISGSWLGIKKISDRLKGKTSIKQKKSYLEECEALIKKSQADCRELLNERYFSARDAVNMYLENRQLTFGLCDDGFLKLRICNGKADLASAVSVKGECDADVEALIEKNRFVDDVPLVADLKAEKFFFAKGNRSDVIGFVRGMAVKTAASSDADDVKMMFLLSESEYSELDFVRWLPHLWSSDCTVRYCGCDASSSARITDILCTELRNRAERSASSYLVVFTSDDSLLSNVQVKKYLASEKDLKVIFIFCSFSADGFVFSGQKNTFNSGVCVPDTVSAASALSFARKMAAAEDDRLKGSALIPDRLSFMEMYSLADRASDVSAVHYSKGKSSEGLKALIGAGPDKRPFVLDLHENGHGPHGLIAGTTGSGKSELIQTLILSLALEYSPEQVAFVLIDYKGGGMSRVFEGLPHVAGVLTNLAESRDETERILVSLSGEIKRRQLVFRDRNVSHIDSYMKLYESGETNESLPHIIMICDEFAELKKEQPEFISELVSISRVGRSLGIHLVLATQRPAGVVDDEIRSNSGFCICLKVRDREDSISLLGRPDAAALTVTGRACVQCGNEADTSVIQTGYSGAEYSPEGGKCQAVMTCCDGTPACVREIKRERINRTEIEIFTERIKEHCERNGITPARKLWNPPLPDLLTAEDALSYGSSETGKGIVFTAGITDDPENQSVYRTEFDLYGTGNILIAGASGSGKSMFLTTMISELAKNYPPEKISFRAADLTGGILSVFAKLPHSGRFISSPDETELGVFLRDISSETEKRKKMFSEVHAADISEYREVCDDPGLVVVIIDGFDVIRDAFPSAEEQINRLAGESVRFGIVFAVTVKHGSDIRIRTRQCFKTVVTFEQGDRTEYTELLGTRPEGSLPSCPGRGLYVSDRRVLNFQCAVCCTGKGREKYGQLLSFCEETERKYRKTDEENRYERFCSFADGDDLRTLAEKYSAEGRVLYWSENSTVQESSEVFTGADGIYDLLTDLKNVFSLRNISRKISGASEGERITVIISSLEEFCKCLSETGNEDMASITEKFFKGGNGLGVFFIAGDDRPEECPADSVYKAYWNNSEGGAAC